MPTFRDIGASAWLVTRTGTERSFWHESWVPQAYLLTELVGVLRAARPAQAVDVDEGWRPDRDLSLAVGRWGWLHIRTVMEEHEHGSCLFRIRTRLRPSFVGTLSGSTLAVVVASGMSASVFIYDLSVTLLVSSLAIAGIGARAAWQAIRGATLLDRAVARVTSAAGMRRLPISTDVGPAIEATIELGDEPAPERTVEVTLRQPAEHPAVQRDRLRAPQ